MKKVLIIACSVFAMVLALASCKKSDSELKAAILAQSNYDAKIDGSVTVAGFQTSYTDDAATCKFTEGVFTLNTKNVSIPGTWTVDNGKLIINGTTDSTGVAGELSHGVKNIRFKYVGNNYNFDVDLTAAK